jgi:predicted tellurium resistance membrane protein TerC
LLHVIQAGTRVGEIALILEDMLDWVSDPNAWAALLTLTAMEIVLGIDNIVFISILAGRLPAGEQQKARQIGLAAAMISRILLLLSLSWIMRLTTPLFEVLDKGVTGRDLILLGGGLFLLWRPPRKSTIKSKDKKSRKALWRFRVLPV